MDLTSLIDWLGEAQTLALGGLLVGLAFGAFAQKSQFCLRAATVSFARGRLDGRTAIWVLAFSSAVAATQFAIICEWLAIDEARQIAARGSLSGALIGGLLFGIGMVLARGCASRLLVLSATGNLRALVTGLVLTIVAQASLRGVLAPAREGLAGAWTVEGGSARNLLDAIGAGPALGLALGMIWLAIGVWLARRNRVRVGDGVSAIGVGLAVACGWVFTFAMTQVAFDPVVVSSVTFTGPSADTLMGLINARVIEPSFAIALVPGVFAGSFLMSLATGTFKLEGFERGAGTTRYLSGAVLMGFGGMLAGGCAVGAGVTGGAIFALTAWTALVAMWAGAMLTVWFTDQERAGLPAEPAASA